MRWLLVHPINTPASCTPEADHRSQTLVNSAIKALLEDKGFEISSPSAADALNTANSLLEWSSSPLNHQVYSQFCASLILSLEKCLPKSTSQVEREIMWGNFHQLRTSVKFIYLWRELQKSSHCNCKPVFYQFITTHVFKEMIKKKFPIVTTPPAMEKPFLTYEEVNAIRYSAGYIPRALQKKLENSCHKLKEELILCLLELTEDDGIADESQDWITQRDRGGLKHVNTAMYMLIVAMEVKFQTVLQEQPPEQLKLDQTVVTTLIKDEQVQYHWDVVSGHWEPEEAEALLPMITQLWVTMRGFAYASAKVEQHKQEVKKGTQKSKGIRKHLI